MPLVAFLSSQIKLLNEESAGVAVAAQTIAGGGFNTSH
jgi:hypothetical protein